MADRERSPRKTGPVAHGCAGGQENAEPGHISFTNEGIREEKCGCDGSCELTECANAAKAQVCEEETSSVGDSRCHNRFRTCRLQLRVTRQGIGVFAARPIEPKTVVRQYEGAYVLAAQRDASYTIKLNARDAGGRQVFVSAKHGGSKARFVAHACNPNTEYVYVRGLRRVVVSLLS